MAEIKKYLPYDKLQMYDELIKAEIKQEIETHTHEFNEIDNIPEHLQFGETVEEEIIWENEEWLSDENIENIKDCFAIINGEKRHVKFDYYDSMFGDSGYYLYDFDTNEKLCSQFTLTDYGVERIYRYKTTTTPIDEKFIPDTIARVNDVDSALSNKADINHNHDDSYYTKVEIDAYELITTADIDEICGSTITPASEVTF